MPKILSHDDLTIDTYVDNTAARQRLSDLMDQGYTLKYIANVLNIHYMTLYAIRNGRYKTSRRSTIDAILNTEFSTVSTTNVDIITVGRNKHTTVKDTIRHLIKEEGYSADDLAERFHTTRYTILNSLEAGSRNLPWEVEQEVLKLLNSDFEDFAPPREVKPKTQHVIFGNEFTRD